MNIEIEYPIFYCNSTDATVNYYMSNFGAEVEENDNGFAVIKIGTARLALNQANGKDKLAGFQALVLKATNITQEFQRLCKVEVDIETGLRDTSYGKTFIVRDCDGNKVEYVE